MLTNANTLSIMNVFKKILSVLLVLKETLEQYVILFSFNYLVQNSINRYYKKHEKEVM
jgi:hypothetical protein